MPRALPVDAATAGDYVSPHELNAELSELVGCANALDRDNFGTAELTRAKLEASAFGGILFSSHPAAAVQTTYAAGEIRTFEQPVLNASGNPWRETVETGDGLLLVEALVNWEEMSGTPVPPFLWCGIRVDGVLVARSPISDRATIADHAPLWATVPVAAGSHTIEIVHGVLASGSVALTIEWHERWVAVREGAR